MLFRLIEIDMQETDNCTVVRSMFQIIMLTELNCTTRLSNLLVAMFHGANLSYTFMQTALNMLNTNHEKEVVDNTK